MNKELIEYGITNENSNKRIHVAPKAYTIYEYDTNVVNELIKNKYYPYKPAYVNGIKTAEGFLIPPNEIPGIKITKLSYGYFISFKENDSETIKGEKATKLVIEYLKKNNDQIKEIKELDIQRSGTDIVVINNKKVTKIQVKCDFRGGGKKGINGCTGNLFIQIKECNPLKKY